MKTEAEMNSLEFLELITQEWCRGEGQEKHFWRDVLTFARKYHKEMTHYEAMEQE